MKTKDIEEIVQKLKQHEKRTLYADSRGREITDLERERIANDLLTTLAKHQEELGKAATERFIDAMIALTKWLIENKHLKAGSELIDMMLQALIATKTDKQ